MIAATLQRVLLGAVLLPLPPAVVYAAVYKCQDAQGRVVYSEDPCPNGTRLDIDTQPSQAPAPPGLRPGEKALLEQLQQRSAEPPPAPEPPPDEAAPPPPDCPGITILALRPFSFRESYTDFDTAGVPFPQVGTRQCARVTLQLEGYFGRLRDSVAEDIRRRLQAVLENGRRRDALSGELDDGPRRLGVRDEVSGEFCFGYSRFEVSDIACR